MKKVIIIFLLPIVLFGCRSLEKPQILSIKNNNIKENVESPVKVISPQQKVSKAGLLFAKTDFQGVLKKSYVKLVFENLESKQTYQLFIGDKSNQTPFSLGVKTVEPGYFFINLPAGKYKISSIAIPVGSTMASEDLNIIVEVIGGVVTYAGTLQIDGTKETVKMGGVPIIKPGFDFNVAIIDERDDGILAFRERYPKVEKEILINLMKFYNL